MANKNLAATITIGGAVASSLTSAFGNVKKGVGQVGSALRQMENQQRQVTQAIQTFAREGKNVDGLRARYVGLTQQIERLRSAHQRLNAVEKASQANLAKRAELRGQMFDAFAAGALAGAPIKIAADAETHDIDMAKQLDGARDSAGKLTPVFYNMVSAVDELAKTMPVVRNEIADTVTNSLRMGVAQQDVLGFTRSILVASSALGLSSADTADQVAKIGAAYGRSATTAGAFLDVVNYLDDKTSATAADLLDFSQRFSGVGKTVGMTAEQSLAWGGTLLNVGTSADVASTALAKLFSTAAQGAAANKNARATMSAIGMNPAAVGKGMTKNADKTVGLMLDRIAAQPKEKQVELIVGLVGQDHFATVAKLIEQREKLADNRKLVTGTEAAGSAEREYQNTIRTTNSQLTMLGNRSMVAAKTIGNVLLPAVNDAAGVLGTLVSGVGHLAETFPGVTRAVVGTTVALVSLRIGTLAAGYGFTFLKGGALGVARVLAGTNAQMALSAAASTRLGAAAAVANGGLVGMASRALPMLAAGIRTVGVALVTTPIGAVVAGIAAGGLAIYKNWDLVKSFFSGFGSGVMEGMAPAIDAVKQLYAQLEFLHPVFEAVGTAVGTVWNWFTKLLDPITHSSEQLGKATTAGETFGRIVGGAINFALTPMQLLIKGFTWIGENGGAILDKVGGAIAKAKSAFTFGSDTSADGGGAILPNAPALPSVPAMATGRGGATTVNNSPTVNLTVNNAQGLNERQLAERVM
ncbi:phage tail tape measure protein, partial [Pseudomonas fluorescens]|uniref:phage tail tape measure protein n=1 Tax=Pseudomonas fluorescens TaxID=294 RepID=UPI00374A6975